MTSPPGPPPPPYGQGPYGQGPYGPPPGQLYPQQGQPYPPPPPQPYSTPAGYPLPPAPPKRKNRMWLILGVVGLVLLLLIAAAIVVAYFLVGRGTVTANNVEIGDCLADMPDGTRVLTVRTVDCAESHEGEVFAMLTMPDGDFPGQSSLEEFSDSCGPALAAYAPTAIEDPSVGVYVLYPTEETWTQGDRVVTCIATVDPPRAGSLKG
ncbi:septum formation family protein [Mycobacterium sp. NPDC050041]|uniref:septum formation family protein n=1 Tax=Mycobacterium sp. NPDC050041 TaxID=3364293 RepID=UPI003C2DEA6C